MFYSTWHNSCSANAVLDSRQSKSFSHVELEIKTSCSKWKVSWTRYENWQDQIKQGHYFRGKTLALSINNSELQFLSIYLHLKLDQIKGLMRAQDLNLWSRDKSDIWSSSAVHCKINIPNLLCSPPRNNFWFLSCIISTGSTGHVLTYNKLQTDTNGTFQKGGRLKKRRKGITSSFPWLSALIFSLVHRWSINVT